MQISEIEIHTGTPDRAFKEVASLKVKCSKAAIFSPDPTVAEVHLKLQEEAAKVYANAVINVEYKRGMSLTSYGVLTATGTAVILESAEVVCPECAETIKRAAKKCRFCGFEPGEFGWAK